MPCYDWEHGQTIHYLHDANGDIDWQETSPGCFTGTRSEPIHKGLYKYNGCRVLGPPLHQDPKHFELFKELGTTPLSFALAFFDTEDGRICWHVEPYREDPKMPGTVLRRQARLAPRAYHLEPGPGRD